MGYETTMIKIAGQQKVKDGMDIAICCIDTQTQTLEYAGAYNPLYLVRKNELTF